MNKILFYVFLFSVSGALGQSFAPPAGQLGSSAIGKDSAILISWATGIDVQRGFRDIAFPIDGLASFGINSNGLGAAEGNSIDVVSLGDGGFAILTFDAPIKNELGPDFAVFENGFADNYLELAFVEVSSDGLNFVRFPSISETPVFTQIGPFEYSDCRYVHNLAGKYRAGFGTPFDLNDLIDSSNIDLNNITHVKLIDVVGSIDPNYGTFDSEGNMINDLYPTNFESSGFDLDAIGVIHQNLAAIKEVDLQLSIYPNPANSMVIINSSESVAVKIHDSKGMLLMQLEPSFYHQMDVSGIAPQLLFVTIENDESFRTERILKIE